eukprot:1615524-Pyramimonas_sp.AAC.1
MCETRNLTLLRRLEPPWAGWDPSSQAPTPPLPRRGRRGSGCCVSAISLADEESVCFCRGTDRENANLLDAEWKSGDWKLAPELRDPLEAVKPKSLHSVHPVKIVFVNTLQIPIVIYWIDYEGTANKYKTLLPGQLYRRAKTISTIMNIINKSVQK